MVYLQLCQSYITCWLVGHTSMPQKSAAESTSPCQPWVLQELAACTAYTHDQADVPKHNKATTDSEPLQAGMLDCRTTQQQARNGSPRRCSTQRSARGCASPTRIPKGFRMKPLQHPALRPNCTSSTSSPEGSRVKPLLATQHHATQRSARGCASSTRRMRLS